MALACVRIGIRTTRHHPKVGNATSIRTCGRAGQSKARNVCAFGQTRQVKVFLRFGTIVLQQLAWAQRIWHHHGHGRAATAGSDFGYHFGVSVIGKLQTTILFLDDHAQETLLLDEIPRFLWQIFQLVVDLPIVEHVAQFFHRAINECLLFCGQLWVWVIQQFLIIRFA